MNNPCLICHAPTFLFDVVDFNKNCEEFSGKFLLPLSGKPIYYAMCSNCGHLFAPEICTWSKERFASDIYNSDYVTVDPGYVETRSQDVTQNFLLRLFPQLPSTVRHLDYGGGNGLTSRLLQQAGWNSMSYDPMVEADSQKSLADLGRFDLITSIEVFEHVPTPHALMNNLQQLLAPNGIVVFTTLLSDGAVTRNKRLDWWYAAPRNGHISLFSQQSLHTLAQAYGFFVGHFDAGRHLLFKELPDWARPFLKMSN